MGTKEKTGYPESRPPLAPGRDDGIDQGAAVQWAEGAGGSLAR